MDGDKELFYNGRKQALCHEIRKPKVSEDDARAIELWFLLMDDRTPGFGMSTIRTEAIIAICEARGVGWDIFVKIKTVEREYFSLMAKEHNKPKPPANKPKRK